MDFLSGANIGTTSLVAPPARQRLSGRHRGDNRARHQSPAGHEELLPAATLAVHAHLSPNTARLHLTQLLHLPARLHPPASPHLLQCVRSLASGGRLQSSGSVLASGCTEVCIEIYFAEREQVATPRLRTAPRSVMPLLLTLVFLALGIACLTVSHFIQREMEEPKRCILEGFLFHQYFPKRFHCDLPAHCSGALPDCPTAPGGFSSPGFPGKQHRLTPDGPLLETEAKERSSSFLP